MFEIDEFVAQCHAALAESQPRLAVKEVVERAVSDPASIDAALGQANAGGLRCLHRSPVSLVAARWPRGVVRFLTITECGRERGLRRRRDTSTSSTEFDDRRSERSNS